MSDLEFDISTPNKKLKLQESEDQIHKFGDFENKVPQESIKEISSWALGCPDRSKIEFVAKLGVGTYGTVSRVRDKKTREEYALKCLIFHESIGDGFPISGLREIRTLRICEHENIVKLFDIIVDDNQVFLLMEYIENDLESILKARTSAFTIAEVKCLVLQLLRGIAFMHDHWVLHRDLKPANILFNNRGVLKIADFGLAREYSSPIQNLTPGVATLRYRAPEILLGGDYTPKVDIWSVGCIFAELLTMEPLFAGHNELEQMNKIISILGSPNDRIWPKFSSLPSVKSFVFLEQGHSILKKSFPMLSETGFSLLKSMFVYDPSRRISAAAALEHPYWSESPLPADIELMPTHRPKTD